MHIPSTVPLAGPVQAPFDEQSPYSVPLQSTPVFCVHAVQGWCWLPSGLQVGAAELAVHLDAGEPLVAKLTPAACEALELAEGTAVHVVIKAQALRRLG